MNDILSREQKALIENILLIADEMIPEWELIKQCEYFTDVTWKYNYEIDTVFEKIISLFENESLEVTLNSDTKLFKNAISREIRRARTYTDISTNNIIKALRIAKDLLKKDEDC